MPNQRNKDKKFVGAWLPGRLYNSVKRTAKENQLSLSEWVTEQLTAAANSGDVNSANVAAPAESSISAAAPVPAPGSPATGALPPVSYRSTPKAPRRSKSRPKPDAAKKAP